MRNDKLTEKSRDAILSAQEVAQDKGNPELTSMHILLALVEQSGGTVGEVLRHLGAMPSGEAGLVVND